jgi:hypothetical protein
LSALQSGKVCSVNTLRPCSLIETAKVNGLEPYAYLRYVFTQLPRAQTVADIEVLLPGNLEKDQIKAN